MSTLDVSLWEFVLFLEDRVLLRMLNINNEGMLHAAGNILTMAAACGYADIASLLLDHGAEKIQDALWMAVRRGRAEVVELLLKRGASVWKTTRASKEALEFAREARSKEVLKLIRDAEVRGMNPLARQ
ncbi:hypothetical protein HDU93_008680 [Gonapodya sp. JEL0774]|nr:hypothetical protein HDU93_008680 [Gonapodya sp. JEL0774]